MTVQRWSPDGSTMIAVPNGRFVLGTDYDAMLDAQRGLTAKAEADAADARKRATEAERYVAGQDVRSDFATAAEMRAALDSTIQSIVTACKGSGCLNAHELRAALDRTHKRATNAEKNLADAERRLALAVAEAKRVLGRELFNRCFLGYDKAWRDAEIAKIRNPTAAAAVKEAGNGD